MNLAVVTHKVTKGDGQGRINFEVVKTSLDRGHRIFTLASEVDSSLAGHPRLTSIKIPVTKWPTELIRNQVFALRSGWWLHRHHSKIDLVLANGSITWASADVNSVHFVHNAWGASPVHTARLHRGPYAWYQWLYTTFNAWWEKRTFQQTDQLIAVSKQVYDHLLDVGITSQCVQVIYNGVDLDEFYPGSSSRMSWALPENKTIALFAGDIRTPRKNLDSILKALIDCPDLHLAIAGDTTGSPYLSMAKQFGLEERTHFLGYCHDMPQLMRAVDFFVLPSRYEPFALVLLEAMATGLPVITAQTVGASDLVDSSCGIVLSDPNDTEALARALRFLTNTPKRRILMGHAAYKVAEQHDFGTMARRYVDLFEHRYNSSLSREC